MCLYLLLMPAFGSPMSCFLLCSGLSLYLTVILVPMLVPFVLMLMHILPSAFSALMLTTSKVKGRLRSFAVSNTAHTHARTLTLTEGEFSKGASQGLCAHVHVSMVLGTWSI